MDEIIIGIGVNDNKKTWFPTEKTCGDDKKDSTQMNLAYE